jgi:hypothetical protein
MSHHDCPRMVRCLSLVLGCCLLAAGADARDVWHVSDQAAPMVACFDRASLGLLAEQPAAAVERGALENDEAVFSPSDEVGMSPRVDYGVSVPEYPALASGVGRWWGEADYLLLWTNGNPVPALVTTNRHCTGSRDMLVF